MIRRIVSVSILFFLLFTFPVYAGPPLDTLKTEVNQVLDLLRQKSLSKEIKKEKLEEIYGRMFDEVEMSRRTLGRNWARLNPMQQREFPQLYRQILAKAYLDRILTYTNEKIIYTRENILSDNQAEIQTKIITSSNEIPINYRMIMKDKVWKVYDVVVENVSLVQNYRSQFNAILARNTPDQLIEILKKKVQSQQEDKKGS
jgi:phospholipid transport system substrate-binding protein